LVGRFGCRRVITSGGLAFCLTLPVLALVTSVMGLAVALLWFGAALGVYDVAINVQAVAVEKAGGRAMMSGFHAFFSLGGMLGAGGVSVLLSLGAAPVAASLVAMAIGLVALGAANRHLLPRMADTIDRPPLFVWPSGAVLVIGCLCFVSFLTEGVMLDWSGVFLVAQRHVSTVGAGLGYAIFSLTMTGGRLAGDGVVRALGARRVLSGGALCATAGLAVSVALPFWWATLVGFGMVGLGAANIVPLLYSALGRQLAMPANLAIAAASTLGYAGILAGPAMIGGVAQLAGLSAALSGVAALLAGVALSAWALKL
jgi:hypothetical protein